MRLIPKKIYNVKCLQHFPYMKHICEKESEKVIVEVDVDDIKEKSILFKNSTQTYHRMMNKSSFELCLETPGMLTNRSHLLDLCREKVDREGYNYKKKKTRSKCITELTEEVVSCERRSRLLQKQRARDKQLRQYTRTATLEEDISKLRREKRKHEKELLLVQKKEGKKSGIRKKSSQAAQHLSLLHLLHLDLLLLQVIQ